MSRPLPIDCLDHGKPERDRFLEGRRRPRPRHAPRVGDHARGRERDRVRLPEHHGFRGRRRHGGDLPPARRPDRATHLQHAGQRRVGLLGGRRPGGRAVLRPRPHRGDEPARHADRHLPLQREDLLRRRGAFRASGRHHPRQPLRVRRLRYRAQPPQRSERPFALAGPVPVAGGVPGHPGRLEGTRLLGRRCGQGGRRKLARAVPRVLRPPARPREGRTR